MSDAQLIHYLPPGHRKVIRRMESLLKKEINAETAISLIRYVFVGGYPSKFGKNIKSNNGNSRLCLNKL
jgi:hypothetical protein